jgi:alkylhydroperoxidase family enzyme
MGTKLDDAMVQAAVGDLDSADADLLDPATVMALRLADVLTSDTPIVSPELHAELRDHFSDDQVLELGAALAVASGWQRFIEAFGIRPDQWTPEMAPPKRPGAD